MPISIIRILILIGLNLFSLKQLKKAKGNEKKCIKDIFLALITCSVPVILLDLLFILPNLLPISAGFIMQGFIILQKFLCYTLFPFVILILIGMAFFRKSGRLIIIGIIILLSIFCFSYLAKNWVELIDQEIKNTQSIFNNKHKSEFGEFVLGPEMCIPRSRHQSILLDDGRVLIIGSVSIIEIYDPKLNKFILGPRLEEKPYAIQAIKLKNGEVFCMGISTFKKKTIVLQIYNPITNEFNVVDHINDDFDDNSLILLDNGNVLIAGGSNSRVGHLKEAYLYNAKTKKLTRTGDLTFPRCIHESILLNNKNVLIFGGSRRDFKVKKMEIYNPVKGVFKDYLVAPYKYLGSHIKLGDDRILFVGGSNEGSAFQSFSNAIYFDEKKEKFFKVNNMNELRAYPKCILLKNGNALIIAGSKEKGFQSEYLGTAEIFNPKTNKFYNAGRMHFNRADCSAVVLKNGKVLITGGKYKRGDNTYVKKAEFFLPKKDK